MSSSARRVAIRMGRLIARTATVVRPERCKTDQHGILITKVFGPDVCSRMEESADLTGLGIDPGNVRTFEPVALTTTQREIGNLRRATMLACNNMIQDALEDEADSGTRQYSQRARARRRTICSRDSGMDVRLPKASCSATREPWTAGLSKRHWRSGGHPVRYAPRC